MLTVIVWTVLLCGAAALIHWAVPRMGTPEPLARVVLVGSIILIIIVIVFLWLGLFGMAPPLR